MMNVIPRPARAVLSVKTAPDGIYLKSEYGLMRLSCMPQGALRVSFTRRESFVDEPTPFILRGEPIPAKAVEQDEEQLTVISESFRASVRLRDGHLRVLSPEGALLFEDGGPCELEAFTARKIVPGEGMTKETVETADGKKTVVREARREDYKELYKAKLPLRFGENEAIYGLGQPEKGPADLRGRVLYQCQTNRTIAVPFFVSTAGYGLLLDCGCPFVFGDTADGSFLHLSAVNELTYYILPGTCEEAVRGYHALTGLPSRLPAWVFGYIQSQERYETAEEILRVAKDYRDRGIGLDCMVLDWCSWPDGEWGQKSFDPARFPDPDAMTAELHDMDLRFMISVWPNTTPGTPNHTAFKEKGLLLPDDALYNALLPEGRAEYWRQAKEGLYRHGVDAWWCDSSEPWTSEWSHAERPLAADTYYETLATASDAIGADLANAYPFFHAMGIYEGQTKEGGKPVVNLTRSAWTGQQRFGTILWSGDIAAKWSTLRDQIAIGLDMCASGMPYWTQDIGGFFVKNGAQWFWDGDFDRGWEDPGFRELFVRWYQYAAFLPVFRGHGTDVRRELSCIEGEAYEAVIKYNRLRYRLLPYIVSLAASVSENGGTMMKPLAFNDPDDPIVRKTDDQFLLGDDILVCPVTEYGARERTVYLPKGIWYDTVKHCRVEGGAYYRAEAPLESMPVFVRAGAVVPFSETGTCAREALSGEIKYFVVPGADGGFTLYRDTGKTRLKWDDKAQRLTADGEEIAPVLN